MINFMFLIGYFFLDNLDNDLTHMIRFDFNRFFPFLCIRKRGEWLRQNMT